MSKAFVNFGNVIASLDDSDSELIQELQEVQAELNLYPTAKVDDKWVASPTNISVMTYIDVCVASIKGMVSKGCQFKNKDYYIFASFGGRPSITKSPNGMIVAMKKMAGKNGMVATVNAGVVFKGYEALKIVRGSTVDKFHLVNSPEMEVGVSGKLTDVLAPYCVITLSDKESGHVISSKVTMVRNNEYLTAKSRGNHAMHSAYPVPMATKIALKRGLEKAMAELGEGEDEDVREAINEHNSSYDIGDDQEKEKEPTETVEFISKAQVKKIEDLLKEKGIGRPSFCAHLMKSGSIKSIETIPLSEFKGYIAQIEKKESRK